MKSVIPFTKELDFTTKVSEITSISLEREFNIEGTSVNGNLFVTGEYKSHEISANVLPFSFKIPFSIEIPDHIKEDSITLEISDFAYDMEENNKIKVNIELELEGEEEVIEEEKEEEPMMPEINPEEIMQILEEQTKKEMEEKEATEENEEELRTDEEDINDIPKEETIEEERKEEPEIEIEEPLETEERETMKEEVNVSYEKNEQMKESEEMIIENVKDSEDEYTTYHIHIVKEGETIETICTMYNSNLSLLNDYNDMSNFTTGSKIIIPENAES